MRLPGRVYQRVITALILTIAASFGWRCGAPAAPELLPPNPPAAYVDENGEREHFKLDSTFVSFPHMRFADGEISLNRRCPVRNAPLNLRLPAVYVNGRPVGFC